MIPHNNIYFQGDTIVLEFYLYKAYINEIENVPWNLILDKIIFELKDNKNNLILRKLNLNAGGNDLEIKLLNDILGHFKIYIPSNESKLIPIGDYIYGIKIITFENEVYTVCIEPLRLLREKIKE